MNTKEKLQFLEALMALPAPEPNPNWEPPEEDLAASPEGTWEERLNDPDNWLVIPEFGVLPQVVNFEGFAHPIIGPGDADAGWRGSLRSTVGAARDEARRRFASLQALHDARLRVLTESGLAGRADPWVADGVFAFYFETFFWHLRQAHMKHRLAASEACIDHLVRAMGMVAFIHTGDQARLANFLHIRSTQNSEAAAIRHAKDPKQAAKRAVKEHWESWQQDPTKYSAKEKFAYAMLDEFPELKSAAVITRWCREWESVATSGQPLPPTPA